MPDKEIRRRSWWLWGLACVLTVVVAGGLGFPIVTMLLEENAASKSEANLRCIVAAIQVYDKSYNHRRYPPVAITNPSGERLLSWRVAILKDIDPGLYEEFKLDEPWDSPHNLKLLDRMPECFRHPRTRTERPGLTFYRGFSSKGTVFEAGRDDIFHNLADGFSNVILLVEASEPAPWTKPDELSYDADKPLPPLGGHFRFGFHVLLCSGDIYRYGNDVDEQLLRRLIIRNDGPPPPRDSMTQ